MNQEDYLKEIVEEISNWGVNSPHEIYRNKIKKIEGYMNDK